MIIGLVQINNSFSGQNYLPYSAALLEAYTKGHTKDIARYHFLPPIYKREPIKVAVEKLSECDIAGFSTYVWNGQISLEIARRLKADRPNTVIIFGGPHVPDQPEEFLRENPFIDIVVHNEGEKTFFNLLEMCPSREWSTLAGVSFIRDGEFVHQPNSERFRDLDEVPSPYLTGIFDNLMKSNPTEHWIGLWETNRGCPFQCTFCDWGSNTAAKVTKFGNNRVLKEIDWFSDHKIEYVFCCDANFGIQKRDVEIAEYAANKKRKTGYPTALSVQNTKNATERAYITQKILSDAGLNKGVALSMQTMDSETLQAIKRDNISLETYLTLQRRFARDKVETYSDLILGLPGESYDSFVNGVCRLIELGQHNRIQFNNLSILPNAEMGNAEYQKRWGMKTVKSQIINIHGERVSIEDDVPEVQQLVIATSAMPLNDWQKTRAFCWFSALLHFDKLFQIPLILIRHLAGRSYRDMLESFMMVDASRYPLLASIRDFFLDEARRIQFGGSEYVYSPDYLGIYWPADEYIFIKLVADKQLSRFYHEAGNLIQSLGYVELIDQAVLLNRALIKQPFVQTDISLSLSADIMAFYNEAREGGAPSLDIRSITVNIDRTTEKWDDLQSWCREVVWWGNKKGAYLYGAKSDNLQLEGHF